MAVGLARVRSFGEQVVAFLRLFKDLCVCVLTGKPFVHKAQNTLSLHFDLFATQSKMRIDAPNELQLSYTRMMMGFLLFNPNPVRIAMIGLGGGSLAKYCYQFLPRSTIVVAEISAEVILLREQFGIPADDERFRVVRIDGEDFVRNPGANFDVLLVDGFDRHGQAPQLGSATFYADCHQCLSPTGLLVVNLARADRKYQDRIACIRKIFSTAIVVGADDNCNQIVFAFPAGSPCTPVERLPDHLEQMEVAHPADLSSMLFKIRREQRRQLLD